MLTLAALPFGFLEVVVAEAAGFYGLYFALPGVVAWFVDLYRDRVPLWARRPLGAFILVLAIPFVLYFLLWTGPLFLVAVPPAAVVFIVAWRLLTR